MPVEPNRLFILTVYRTGASGNLGPAVMRAQVEIGRFQKGWKNEFLESGKVGQNVGRQTREIGEDSTGCFPPER
jgi:hypothetical protein